MACMEHIESARLMPSIWTPILVGVSEYVANIFYPGCGKRAWCGIQEPENTLWIPTPRYRGPGSGSGVQVSVINSVGSRMPGQGCSNQRPETRVMDIGARILDPGPGSRQSLVHTDVINWPSVQTQHFPTQSSSAEVLKNHVYWKLCRQL